MIRSRRGITQSPVLGDCPTKMSRKVASFESRVEQKKKIKASALPVLFAGVLYSYNVQRPKYDIFNGHNKHCYAQFEQK
jgi:hypothetical protein|tara:strand:- start:1053 stop:1289 length:237 start_codon:yes stop_codon:yes gene_type:complete